MTSDCFPYEPRPGQEQLMGAIRSACNDRAHLVVESGTGTGKTVCTLTAMVESCKERGKKLLYVTRTNSQQRQVMLELREISELTKVFGVALQGRRNMCPLAKDDSELSQGNPEELSRRRAASARRESSRETRTPASTMPRRSRRTCSP
jgi:DNA excision repair protein ERCC-2